MSAADLLLHPLTTDGTLDDTKAEIAADHSGATETYYAGPASGRKWQVDRIVVTWIDATIANSIVWGDAGTLSATTLVLTESDGSTTAVDLTFGLGLSGPYRLLEAGWKHEYLESTAQADIWQASLDCDLVLEAGERVLLSSNDNLSGVSDLYITLHGKILV